MFPVPEPTAGHNGLKLGMEMKFLSHLCHWLALATKDNSLHISTPPLSLLPPHVPCADSEPSKLVPVLREWFYNSFVLN